MFGAFVAGLLSFLSPCVLPVVPSYLSYITGASGAGELTQRRHLALLHATLFVIGFSIIFIILGATTVDGKDGLEKAHQTHYDFILCDMKMPNMDGMDFLKSMGRKLDSTSGVLEWKRTS